MVIGIDMSNILDQAEKIVRSNGFSEDRKSFTRASGACSVYEQSEYCVVEERAKCSGYRLVTGVIWKRADKQKSCF